MRALSRCRMPQTAAAELNTLCTMAMSTRAHIYTSAAHPADDEKQKNPLQRFYRRVHVAPAPQGGHKIMLDSRALKSPAGEPLILPTRLLALAIAAEWEQQDSGIKPFTMPLMTLAATAVDQPKPRDAVIDTMLQYLHTDSSCLRDDPGPLAERQAEVFDPILRWAEGKLGTSLRVGSDIMGMQQSEELVAAARKHLHGLDQWHLAAVDAAASACRSVILGLALINGRLSVAETMAAARVEEDFQIEEWGLVEGGHDIDIADTSARIAAAALFSRLNR